MVEVMNEAPRHLPPFIMFPATVPRSATPMLSVWREAVSSRPSPGGIVEGIPRVCCASSCHPGSLRCTTALRVGRKMWSSLLPLSSKKSACEERRGGPGAAGMGEAATTQEEPKLLRTGSCAGSGSCSSGGGGAGGGRIAAPLLAEIGTCE